MFLKITKKEYEKLMKESVKLEILKNYLEVHEDNYVKIEPLLAIAGCSCQTGGKDDA